MATVTIRNLVRDALRFTRFGLLSLACGVAILPGVARAAVDPRNLTSTGNLVLSPDQSVGQTFVTRIAGRLTGIEFAPQRDAASPTDVIDIEVFDHTGASLGTASIMAGGFPPGNSVPATLSTTSTGPGFFDLSSFEIRFEKGDSLSFVMTKLSPGAARAGISGDVYPDGTALTNGSPFAAVDLAFKVIFVPVPKLLVGAANDSTVLGYDAMTGSALGRFTTGGPFTSGPSSLVIGNAQQSLFVKTWSGPRIDEYDALRGSFIRTLVSTDVHSGGGGLVIGADNRIYGANASGGITRWSISTGASAGQFIAAGSGGLGGVGGMAFGADGNLYVGSINFLTGQHQVLRYNGATGAFINAFVPSGSGGLIAPDALVFGPDGDLFVTSRNTNNVLRFNGTTGAFIGVFATGGGLSVPFGLVFGPDGQLYVSSMGTNEVLRYDGETGAFIDVFASNTHNAPSGVIFNEGELPPAPVDVGPTEVTAARLGFLRVTPNPVRSSAHIEFELRQPAAVTVAVFDVQGRLVRSLRKGDRAGSGHQRLDWDARDAAGRPVAAGIYLVRLTTDEKVLTQKVVLTK